MSEVAIGGMSENAIDGMSENAIDDTGEIAIRREGCAGRITLQRPEALNALSYDMVRAISAALRGWADDDAVRLVILDAAGERAFCAGGDIADMYRTGKAGDFAYGQRFWRDEYRMNAQLARFPKPVVAFMQGFVMGGGVGVACHGSHRIACDSTKVAMPECAIGLVPDVGGSLLLARAPGRLGAYLGTTGYRMNAADAIYAGFADYHIASSHWPELIDALCQSGDVGLIEAAASTPGAAPLAAAQAEVDAYFSGQTLADILDALGQGADTSFNAGARKKLGQMSPLSLACAVEIGHRLRGQEAHIETALDLEYRFVARSMAQGDFLEGIRAAIIDKDRNPRWRHALHAVTDADVSAMLEPLGAAALDLEDTA